MVAQDERLRGRREGRGELINHSHGSVKKIHTSIMDMWPEAVTSRLAEPLHHTAAQPLAQQQQQKTQITLAPGKPLHVNTTCIYWLSCKNSRISPVARTVCQSKSHLASKVPYCAQQQQRTSATAGLASMMFSIGYFL